MPQRLETAIFEKITFAQDGLMTNEPRVLAFPAATPQAVAVHFAAELTFEVDPDDLMRDIVAGDRHDYVVVETRAPEAFAAMRTPGARTCRTAI